LRRLCCRLLRRVPSRPRVRPWSRGALHTPGSAPYNGQIECRVEEEEAFQGQDLYLCKLGVKGLDNGAEYIYAVMVGGKLHTHQTDPAEIPAKVFDPSF
jgi:hypothetical protein